MALYGILHIPTGNFVHIEFFSHRQHLTFTEEVSTWFYNQKHEFNDGEGARPSSVYGFFVKPELTTNKKRLVLLALSDQNLLRQIQKLDNFNEQVAMDLYNTTDWDDFIETVGGGDSKSVWPNKAEFSIQPLDIPSIKSTADIYTTLPLSEGVQNEDEEEDD